MVLDVITNWKPRGCMKKIMNSHYIKNYTRTRRNQYKKTISHKRI